MTQPTMTRGRFLGTGALATSAALLPWSRTARAAAAPITGRRIDIHGHAITPALEALLARRGSRMLDGRALPSWSVSAALAFQARQSLDLQVLSTPDPAMALATLPEQPSLARAINDDLAAIVQAHPKRFGALAVLPLQSGSAAALAELTYALDRRRLDGVILPTNVDGKYLGDDLFAPVLSALAKRKTPVLVHPASPRAQDWPETQGAPADGLEHAFELVRCASSLLYSGASLRYSTLRLTFASGGGGLPFMSARVAVPDQAIGADLFIRPLRAHGFDTAQSSHPGAIASLAAFVNAPTQLHFGSDWPLVAEPRSLDRVMGIAPPEIGLAIAGDSAMLTFPSIAARLRA